ncbi:MAG: glycosyltransferase, partial [Brachybacterium sp.]|nr:glycosyltransferase [Brachybacterium sp.]
REKEHDRRWRWAAAPLMRWICRTCLPQVRSVTTVSPGLAEAYARDYEVVVEVVMNAADHVDGRPRPTTMPIRMLHTGAARANRRLELLIDAMRGIDHATLDLMLVESEPGVIAALRSRAADLPQVRFRDPVPYTDLVPTVAEYDASVVFFPPATLNLRHTLPNKLFEAVQGRNALVVSPSPDMANLVRRHELGVVADSFSAESLHRALLRLTPERVDRFKRAADAASTELSSTTQVAVWVRAIEQMERRA